MKYAVITFGCRVNQADSLGFEEELLAGGAEAASPEHADLVVVNTCSVTATADQGARQTIRRVARDNPSAQIVVTGCYATRRRDEVAALPNVVRVVPNDDKPRLIALMRGAATFAPPALRRPAVARAELVERRWEASSAPTAGEARPFTTSVGADLASALQPTTAQRDDDGPCGATIEPGVAGRTAFTLRVQTGCSEPCTYCIIPSTRGEPRSRPVAELLREVERIAAAGFKEIALTGVHLGSYGRDLTPRSSLFELLIAIRQRADETTSRRADALFRISSLEPMDCTADIVDLVATSDRFAPHFHLPLQHASDRVLAAMRRPYTIAEYSSLVDHIRAKIPHASIGSDIIVGFPGETDEDSDRLATYLERSPLTHVHVFPYSDRPGTVAAAMRQKVPGAVIRDRARRIREIGHHLATAFRDAQIDTAHRALTLEDGSLVVTGNYLKLRIPPGRARNEWVRVRVVNREVGELVNS